MISLESSDMARVTQEHIDARKAAILDAAAQLFTSRGASEPTMQEIAEEAGLSAGAIYRYYPSKDDLLQAYFEYCVAEGPVSLINQTASLSSSPREQLRTAAYTVRDMWRQSGNDKIIGEMETILAAARDPEDIGKMLRCARRKVHDAIEEIVKQGQQTGEIDPDLDSRTLAITLFAFVYGIGVMSLEHEEEERDAMFDTLSVVLDRLGPSDS